MAHINTTFDPTSVRHQQPTGRMHRTKYPRFYYTQNEDVNQRRSLEIKRAKELCRGEVDPVVSMI